MQIFADYLAAELKEAGLTDEAVTSALQKLYSHEKLGPKLNNLVKTATEDYQAQVGRAQTAQARADKLEKEWFPKANAEYLDMQQKLVAALAETESLKGNGNGLPPGFDPKNFVTREDINAFQADLAKRYSSVIKDTGRITAKHVNRFKEEPDFEAIDKIAQERSVPIGVAYDLWAEPKVKEQEAAAAKEREKSMRAEIERDVLSRYKLPIPAIAEQASPFFNIPKEGEKPVDVNSAMLDALNGVTAGTRP